MLLKIFIGLCIIAFGTSIVECRTEYNDKKLFKNVDRKNELKFDVNGVAINCSNDLITSEDTGEVMKVQIMDNDNRFLDGNEINEGRRKKRKGFGRILLYMIGAAKATILYITAHAVAAVAAKALIIAKVALAVATAIALKKASEHNEKTSYEIVKHPHHSYIQTHSSSIDYDHHGGYERSYGHRKRRYIVR